MVYWNTLYLGAIESQLQIEDCKECVITSQPISILRWHTHHALEDSGSCSTNNIFAVWKEANWQMGHW